MLVSQSPSSVWQLRTSSEVLQALERRGCWVGIEGTITVNRLAQAVERAVKNAVEGKRAVERAVEKLGERERTVQSKRACERKVAVEGC